jgi:hypothetical protein
MTALDIQFNLNKNYNNDRPILTLILLLKEQKHKFSIRLYNYIEDGATQQNKWVLCKEQDIEQVTLNNLYNNQLVFASSPKERNIIVVISKCIYIYSEDLKVLK